MPPFPRPEDRARAARERRAAGQRLGKDVQFAIKASKSGDWHVDAASGAPVVSTPYGDLALVEGEYELINRVEEENATRPPLRLRRSADRWLRDPRHRAGC